MRNLRFARSSWFALVLFVLVTLTTPAPSFARFSLFITIAPPALPVYAQPVCPGPGYIWTPGYWAWSPYYDDYYWVPGTWVTAPQVGLLWTPGYWGWVGGAFVWNAGYWAPHVGFYGGINYGFGYTGVGYAGGYWIHGAFFYNRAVNNVTSVRSITRVYNQTVVNNYRTTNVSYNGGTGGITARPTAAELVAARDPHVAPTVQQTQHQQAASANRMLQASVNHGKPLIAATSRPGVFSGRGVVAAKAATPSHPAAQSAANRTAPRAASPARSVNRPLAASHPAAAQPKSMSRPATTARGSAPRPERAPRASRDKTRA